MSQRVLITGANGQLAHALMNVAPQEMQCIGRTSAQLDICDASDIATTLREIQPSLVINGAAYNLVDKAQREGMEDALRVNALGVGRLADACSRAGIPMVHFSTAFVFDGQKRSPYTEVDHTHPLGVYAASKLAGENIALASSEHNIVIRVNNLFGPSPSVEEGSLKKPMGNFALLMLHLARERTKVEVVYDQVSTPTYTPDLAEAVWQLAQQTHGGLFHLSNAGEVSYADYAQEVFRLAGVACEVKPVSSKMYAAAARRPLYSTLSNKKAHDAGVTPLRYWHEALEVFIQSLRTTGGLGRRNGN